MDLREMGCEVMYCELAPDKVQLWDFVNIIMNLGFHKAGNFLTSSV